MMRPWQASRAALQHSLDLDGMVPVVVVDPDIVPLAGESEAALDAAEGGKPLGDVFRRDAETLGNRDRGRSIRNIVTAGHRQAQVLQRDHLAGAAAADLDVENGCRAIHSGY